MEFLYLELKLKINMNNFNSFQNLIKILENHARINIMHKKIKVKDYKSKNIKDKINTINEVFDVDYFDELNPIYPLFGNIELHWRFINENQVSIGGEFRILDISKYFFKVPKLWNETMQIERINFLKELRIFDDHKFSGDGELTAFRVGQDRKKPEIWFINSEGLCFLMDLTPQEYFQSLLHLSGAYSWQYLFCEVNLRQDEFRFAKKNIENMLAVLPELLPEINYETYYNKLQERL